MRINRQHAQSIVNEMKGSIHRDMNIMNQEGVIIASTNPARCGQLHQGAAELIERRLPCLTVREDNPAHGVQAGINLPIVIDNELAGVIGITGNPDEVSIFGDIIKRMTEIMLESVRQKENSDLMDRAKGLFMENWLFTDQPDWPELEVRGRLLGIDIAEPYTIAILQPAKAIRTDHDRADRMEEMQSSLILQMIQRHLQTNRNHCCAVIRNRIIVLLHRSSRSESASMIGKICQDIESYYSTQVAGGISSASQSPADIRRCYLEAQTASAIAVQSAQSSVLFYDEVSLEFIMQSIPRPITEDLRRLVFAACQEDERKELLHTIRLYFDCGGSIRRCADASFVHRNTFQYRMDCLRKKTGYDLRIPKDAVLLYLAAYADLDP